MEFEKLTKEQEATVAKCLAMFKHNEVCYLRAQPRTGKSFMANAIATGLGVKKVLFLTTLKAAGDAKKDSATWHRLGLGTHEVDVFNHQKAPKINGADYDFVVIDEAHNFKAYNHDKALGKYQKAVRRLLDDCHGPVLLMSGTPAPENELGYFRQFWLTGRRHPWGAMAWRVWHKAYAWTTYEAMGPLSIPCHKPHADRIEECISGWCVDMSQTDAGFSHSFVELCHFTDANHATDVVLQKMRGKKTRNERVEPIGFFGEDLSDPSARRMAIHKLAGGFAVNTDTGEVVLVCDGKMRWIEEFLDSTDENIAVYHFFRHEGHELMRRFGDKCTTDIEEFASGKKRLFIGQVRADSCGVRLSSAGAMVVYSSDYSATNYMQWRDRLVFKGRDEVPIHWLFNESVPIDQSVHMCLKSKQNYTLSLFKKDF